MIPIPGHPDYFVNGTNIVSTKYNKIRILKPGKNKKGYLSVVLQEPGKKKTCDVHRLIAQAYLTNFSENLIVDHIDRNKLNNNINNLRMITFAENLQNVERPDVRLTKHGRYQARITINYNRIHLGYFATENEAIEAYYAAKKIHHPAFTS